MQSANTQTEPDIHQTVPVFSILSGVRRGHNEILTQKTIRIITLPDSAPRFLKPDDQQVQDYHATLHRIANTYEIAVAPEHDVWINGQKITGSRVLKSGDLLEIGHGGPVLRYRIYPHGTVPAKTIVEVLGDSMNGAQADSKTTLGRTSRFLMNFTWNLLTQTALWFRIWVLIVLTILIFSIVVLMSQNIQLQKHVASEQVRLEEIELLMKEFGSPELSHQDLVDLQAEVRSQLAGTLERLETLEAGTEKASQVIASATPSVVFLLGAFKFVDPETGRTLHVVESGNRISRFSLEPEGKIMELAFTGTAFIVTENGLLLTNKHVIEFSSQDPRSGMIQGRNYTPVMIQLLAYFPGRSDPVYVEVAHIDEQMDMVLLRPISDLKDIVPLAFEPTIPKPGEEVLLLGYPLGISALVARASPGILESITMDGTADFWTVALKLSEAGYIKPLATRGIVGQVSDDFVVYDAETTFGGSGGPVLNLDGNVIAINTAIIPEFGGSNLGILSDRIMEFINRHKNKGNDENTRQ